MFDQKAYAAEHRQNNREMYRQSSAKYSAKRHTDPHIAELYNAKRDRYKARQRRYYAKAKREVFAAYGDKCACCSELNAYFLTIDHVDGNGKAHRKESGHSGRMYVSIRKQGYPATFRLLCMNCNWGRHHNGMNGTCPHLLASSESA